MAGSFLWCCERVGGGGGDDRDEAEPLVDLAGNRIDSAQADRFEVRVAGEQFAHAAARDSAFAVVVVHVDVSDSRDRSRARARLRHPVDVASVVDA